MKGFIAVLVICFLMLFGVAMHNIDNAWNMRSVEMQTGMIGCDQNVLTQCVPPDNLYMIGMSIILILFVLQSMIVAYIMAER